MDTGHINYDITCRRCGNIVTLSIRDKDLTDWRSGKYAQDAFPYLSPSQRELIISQTCGSCWTAIFGDDE